MRSEHLPGHAFWAKTKSQVFGVLLNELVHCVRACSEDIEGLENITYLDSVVQNLGLVHDAMYSFRRSI